MEKILRNALAVIANLTDGFVALTDREGVRLKVIDANGNSIVSLENLKLKVAEKAVREQKVLSGPSELSRDSKLWAIPIGDYALIVTDDGKKQKQNQLEYSLKDSLHMIADVLGSEVSLFDEIGKVTHSVGRDGTRNDAAVGQINQDAYTSMVLFKSQVLESSSLPGARSILIPITKQVGLEFSNVPARAAEPADKREKDKSASKYTFDDLIGSSAVFERTKAFCRRVSRSQSSVLLLGESGTGKELFAHAIHHASDRAAHRFIPFNCGAVPANLIESILFGYETGTFTGGSPGGKKGLFVEADRGTLFLDEIGEMDLHLQTRLLRVLQEKEVMSLGSAKSREVDVRIIAATNQNLERLVAEGKFREDLYYRINVVPVAIPSLRERSGDIEELVDSFIKEFNVALDKRMTGCSPEAMDAMRAYSWPGNVRQLRNCVERAANLLDGGEIGLEHLPEYLVARQDAIPPSRPEARAWKVGPGRTLDDVVRDFERSLIEQALAECNDNKQETARKLGISSTTLWRKMNPIPLDEAR
ncbi:sigma 54-interacting transcriptional regulator [Paenibacillaceae bacterium WGS1546]|uniref:sigma-54 interaction domain-containing protein n=1 Tax=Cohnella sp. WGS1546 TaxID=3366810 RepID=UPI00372CEF74